MVSEKKATNCMGQYLSTKGPVEPVVALAVGWNVVLMEFKGFMLNYWHLSNYSSHSGPQDQGLVFPFSQGCDFKSPASLIRK